MGKQSNTWNITRMVITKHGPIMTSQAQIMLMNLIKMNVNQSHQTLHDNDSQIGENSCQNDHEDQEHGNHSWIGETKSQFSHEDDPWHDNKPNSHEDESWLEENESQFSLEEEGYGREPEYEDFPHKGEFTHEQESHAKHQPWQEESDANQDNFGHSQGPEAYLSWERDVEIWFQSNRILEEEKTSYAEDTLTEDAYRHWDREDTMRLEFDEPTYSWEDMKQLMYDEFVKGVAAGRQCYVKIYRNPEPRLATNPKAKPKNPSCFEPREFKNTFEEKTEEHEVTPTQVIDHKETPTVVMTKVTKAEQAKIREEFNMEIKNEIGYFTKKTAMTPKKS
ncbi:unnamed protein product [Arabis nemorensis]|uniref:Uncharacterized protein n=1 Tax=Arabis nemorensis TaxID=586526 RepID=A0A565BT12_9BRAS|nr:unnamed protein product [Arabis nemorensis]